MRGSYQMMDWEKTRVTNMVTRALKNLKEYLVKQYADVKMGARPLKRGIQSAVEDALAEQILSGKVQPGNKVTVTVKGDKVTFLIKDV